MLGILAVAGAVLRGPRTARTVLAGTAAAGGAAVLLGISALLRPDGLPWELPLAPGGRALTVALDGLSGWFLLLLGAAALAACARPAARDEVPARASLVPLPLFVAGAALAVMAADAATLLLGFVGTLVAAWLLVAAGRDRSGKPGVGAGRPVAAVLAGAALFAALACWGAGTVDLSFRALRAAPPEGWRAVLVPVLVVAGVGLAAGALPFRPPPGVSPRVAVLAVGAAAKVSLYVLARLLLDLGAALPPWWAPPLVLLGAASALAGVLGRAGDDPRAAPAAAVAAHSGLMVMVLGLVPLFRAADLGPLAAFAAAALLLHALARVLVESLLFLVAGEADRMAGPDGPGGLGRSAPLLACCAAAGLLGAAGLPPGLGFASNWLLLQSLIAGWRTGGAATQVVVVAALAATTVVLLLSASAAVRWFGLVFLGRPRGARAAGAADISGPGLAALAFLAALVPVLGLLPGPLLHLADPALRSLSGAAMEERAGALALLVGDGMGSYLPLGSALLLLGCGASVFAAVRACGPLPVSAVPAWEDGRSPSAAPLPAAARSGKAPGFAPWLGARNGGEFRFPAFASLLGPLGRTGGVAGVGEASDRRGLLLVLAVLVVLVLALAWPVTGAPVP